MSKGLADLQQTIQSYGDSANAIQSYVDNYDNQFFQNWKDKVQEATDKIEAGRKVADGVGEAYLGGKVLHAGYQKYVEKYGSKKGNNPGDEDGDGSPENSSNQPTGEDDNADQLEAEDDPMSSVARPTTEDVGGEQGYELNDINTGDRPLATDDSGDPVETSFGDDGAVDVPSTSGTTPSAVTTEPDLPPPGSQTELRQMGGEGTPGGETPGTTQISQGEGLSSTRTQADILEGDPEANVGGLGAEGGTEASTLGDTLTSGASDLATAGTTALTEGGADVGALGIGAEALGPLGLLAGVGIGLYELFHHPAKKPPPPVLQTASSKGEMVLPSYDSVIDTPASVGAF
jgi:hypothetical protein